MNQYVANLRRLLAVAAAVSLLSGLTSAPLRAQADAKPAEPAAAPKPAAPAKPAKVKKPKPPELSLEEQKKADGVYAKGTNWLSFRAGWAKRTGELAGNGSMGYGLGYQHMMSRKWAFAAGAGYDIVGRFGASADEAVPFTGEFQRHFKWKTAVRPYVGVGGGFYLRKNYRTAGEYTTTTTGGPHFSFGFTSALDAKHVIGLDARVAKLDARAGIVNPTFGLSKDSETVWTVKGSWALAY